MAYRTRINKVAVARIVGQKYSKAAVRRAAETVRDRAQTNVITDGLIDSGELSQSFRVKDVTVDIMRPTMKVGSTAPHAKFPEHGTQGSEAPPGKVLRFKPKGGTMFIFRKRVRGVPAYGFMRRAKNSLRVADFLPRR